MVVIVAPAQADAAIKSLGAQGLKAWTVGEVVERPKGALQTIVIKDDSGYFFKVLLQ
jgi:phosphoribosylformylglycinamidine cyclo-ligase